MAHLITPVEIDSTAYCPICQTGRSTKAVLTTDHALPNQPVATPDCGPWQIFTGHEDSDEGEISFGVACGTTVEFLITSTVVNPAHEYLVDVDFLVDGVYDSGASLTELSPDDTIILNLPGGACGSVITAYAYPTATIDYFDATVTLAVTAIT